MSGHDLILNYNDAVLYRSDLRILRSPSAWLNDACVNFRLTRIYDLRERQWRAAASSASSAAAGCGGVEDRSGSLGGSAVEERSVPLFLDPSVVSYMMHQCDDDDLADLARSWNLGGGRRGYTDKGGVSSGGNGSGSGRARTIATTLIFAPVNDGHAASAEAFRTPGGGNHWSALLAVVSERRGGVPPDNDARGKGRGEEDARLLPPEMTVTFGHFDSHHGWNRRAASAVARRMERAARLLLPPPPSGPHAYTFSSDGDDDDGEGRPIVAEVRECETPQQGNGYDCGLHALGAAEALTDPSLWLAPSGDGDNIDVVVPGWEDLERALEEFVDGKSGGGEGFRRRGREEMVSDVLTLAEVYRGRRG